MKDILAMVGRSLQSPREGASEVLSLGIPREAVGTMVALVVVLSVFFGHLGGMMLMPADRAAAFGLFGSALVAGVAQLLFMVVMIGAVFWIGRAMGGTGSMTESAIVVCWLQFIMVCIQVIQLVILVLLPPLVGLVWLVAIGIFLWLLTNFVAVLHGFKSLGQVFVMIMVSTGAIIFLLSLLLMLLGIELTMPEASA